MLTSLHAPPRADSYGLRPFAWSLLGLLFCIGCAPSPKLEIRITGDDHRWFVMYPGPDGLLGSADDLGSRRDVVIPIGHDVTLHLDSIDYIYTFAVPQLALKQMASPGLDFALQFSTDQLGTFALNGGQMCGLPIVGELNGTFTVTNGTDFNKAMAALPPYSNLEH